MKDKKEILIYILLALVFGAWGFVVQMQNETIKKLEIRTGKIENIEKDHHQGKRVDPFRCSDAQKYIDKTIPCFQIEQEVNKK